MIRVGIIGVSGYGGGELARILAIHPEAELTYACSETYKDKDIGEALPNMRGVLKIDCQSYEPEQAIELCDVVFFARHHGWAMEEASKLLDMGVNIIDLSADFRLKDTEIFQQWYKSPHTSPELLGKAVYGMPELYKEKIAGANLVANPGCYPTTAILAIAPLLKERIIDPDTIVIDSKSGVSGAGRSSFKQDYHFPELNESMKAYNIGIHRHTPEIEQELANVAGRPITISFTPHLIPITRGILTTAYSGLIGEGWSTDEMLQLFREFYREAPFVVIRNADDYPSTKDTYGSNFCHICMKVDQRTNRVIVTSVIDNLVKGMAGTAVQNMNLMFGLDETTALKTAGVFP